MKRCTVCKVEKETSEFYKRAASHDGLSSKCKVCKKAYAADYGKKNSDRIKANKKKYYAENAETIKAKRKQYVIDNPDIVNSWIDRNRDLNNEKSREYYRTHKKEEAARFKKYAETHREVLRVKDNRRRARKAENGGTLTTHEWLTVKSSWHSRCASCATDQDIAMDHIVSIKAGGRNDADNVQPLCRPCNSSKGAKSYSFLRSSSWQRKLINGPSR